jgi:hypothetical protein
VGSPEIHEIDPGYTEPAAQRPEGRLSVHRIAECLGQPVETLVAAQLESEVEVCWWHVLDEKLYGWIAVGSNRRGKAVLVLLRGGTTSRATHRRWTH